MLNRLRVLLLPGGAHRQTVAVTVPAPRADVTADAVLAALDPEQRAAARAVRGPLVILAGAGTGKTP